MFRVACFGLAGVDTNNNEWEATMSDRRLVGVDLGIASAHTIRVLDGEGVVVAKRRASPTVESLVEIERAALAGTPAGTRLEVVMEPTGAAWLPIAVFFTRRGHLVYRVSSAKSHDLRQFLSRHTKTNGIDADTLARIPLFDPAGLTPLALIDADRAALDRRVRATDRLTKAGADHKRRIKDLIRQVMPMTPLTSAIRKSDLVVLERYADPNALVRVGAKRLTRIIAKASGNQQGHERACEWITAATLALELWAWTVMNRGTPYVVCDIDGTPVTPAQAKAIIADQWTVTADVRQRRRSAKTTVVGKAPQTVSTRQPKPHTNSVGKRGDLPRPTSSTPKRPPIKDLAETSA